MTEFLSQMCIALGECPTCCLNSELFAGFCDFKLSRYYGNSESYGFPSVNYLLAQIKVENKLHLCRHKNKLLMCRHSCIMCRLARVSVLLEHLQISRCLCKGFGLLCVGTKLLENLSLLSLMLVKQVLKDKLSLLL